MADSSPSRPRSKLLSFANRVRSSLDHTRPQSQVHGNSLLAESPPSVSGHGVSRALRSPSLNNYDELSTGTHGQPELVSYNDETLLPPIAPYADTTRRRADSNNSSRQSSFTSLKDLAKSNSSPKERPASLSVNYVPAKFTARHEPGNRERWARKAAESAKYGGGRDAFARDAQRMGDMGTVDDDEGVVFQLGKGGLQRKNKPKLRWNRFKWVLFAANSLLIVYGITALVSAILVWLNVFYQSDVIRVGNRSELIVSTVAGAMLVLTSLIGFSGIMLNNRPFLAIYTFLLWICLGLLVAPGYMTYKQRTFNLEGKLNLQWSRILGSQGRLRIQDALRCCGYYSPEIEATISPLCYTRSNLPGCKSHYLRLERHVLDIWYIVSFALVPAQIGIIIAALLCSNHITYRFGKGLTPKRYRLDMGTMAVIMDEYASQIAAQYGNNLAVEALSRSSLHLPLEPTVSSSPFNDSYATASGSHLGLTRVTSRAGSTITTNTTGYNSQGQNYSGGTGLLRPPSGAALFDPRRDSWAGSASRSDDGSAAGGGGGGRTASVYSVTNRYSDAPEDNRRSFDSRYGTMGSGGEDVRDRERERDAGNLYLGSAR